MKIRRLSLKWSGTAAITLPNLGSQNFRISSVAFTQAVDAENRFVLLEVLNGAGELCFASELVVGAGTGTHAAFSVNSPVNPFSVQVVANGYLPPDLWLTEEDTLRITPSGAAVSAVSDLVITTEQS